MQPNGFALAFFPGTIDGIETELPNLTLEKLQKSKVEKKSATPVKKGSSAKVKASKKQKAKAKAKASKKKRKNAQKLQELLNKVLRAYLLNQLQG